MQLAVGDFEAADRMIALSPEFPVLQVFSGIIQAKKGDFAVALAIADGFGPPSGYMGGLRVKLLNEIAVMQAMAGKTQEAKRTLADALDTARARDDVKGRAYFMSTVAAAQAKAGDPKAARQTFAQAAEVFEVARKKDAPEWIPKSDPHSLPSYRASVDVPYSMLIDTLKRIAQAQAEAGFFEEAIKTALSIDVVNYRVEALMHIARHLARKPRRSGGIRKILTFDACVEAHVKS